MKPFFTLISATLITVLPQLALAGGGGSSKPDCELETSREYFDCRPEDQNSDNYAFMTTFVTVQGPGDKCTRIGKKTTVLRISNNHNEVINVPGRGKVTVFAMDTAYTNDFKRKVSSRGDVVMPAQFLGQTGGLKSDLNSLAYDAASKRLTVDVVFHKAKGDVRFQEVFTSCTTR